MAPVKVKVCGNTNVEDVRLAAAYGADYLGFIFAESKRQITPDQAREIIKAVPNFKNFVGVFVNAPKTEVEKTAAALGLKILQFHGDETALYCRHFSSLGFQIIKTFRVKDAMSLKRIDEYNVDAFLLDTYHKDARGGTGKTFDWTIIDAHPHVREKLFLAGGLNVENVGEAVQIAKPYAVDVASGVESQPGKKDPELLKLFIEAVKRTTNPHALKGTVRS